MRTLLVLCLLAGLGAVLYAIDRDLRAHAPDRVAAARETAGIRSMLRASLELADPVIGRAKGDMRDFRGRLAHEGRLKPVFGQARRLCLKGQDMPDCWEVAYLEIDGAPVEADDAVDTAPPADAPGTPAEPVFEAAIEAVADAPAEPAMEWVAAPPVAAAAPERMPGPVADPPAASETEPQATHVVARPVINTRAGPGTDHPVLTRLKADIRLALVNAQDDWGRFTILDGDAAGETVWAALRILEPLAATVEGAHE